MIEGKLPRSAASKKYKISTGTISHKLHNRHMLNVGSPTRLTPDEEKEIVTISTCGDWSYPLSTWDIRFLVKHYLENIGEYLPIYIGT